MKVLHIEDFQKLMQDVQRNNRMRDQRLNFQAKVAQSIMEQAKEACQNGKICGHPITVENMRAVLAELKEDTFGRLTDLLTIMFVLTEDAHRSGRLAKAEYDGFLSALATFESMRVFEHALSIVVMEVEETGDAPKPAEFSGIMRHMILKKYRGFQISKEERDMEDAVEQSEEVSERQRH